MTQILAFRGKTRALIVLPESWTVIVESEHRQLDLLKEDRETRREELNKLLITNGYNQVEWKFPEETGFYQPIVIAKK